MTPEQMADIDEQYRVSHYPFPLCDDLEKLRIQLDSLIKEVDHRNDRQAWEQLVQAKDLMGSAILDLRP